MNTSIIRTGSAPFHWLCSHAVRLTWTWTALPVGQHATTVTPWLPFWLCAPRLLLVFLSKVLSTLSVIFQTMHETMTKNAAKVLGWHFPFLHPHQPACGWRAGWAESPQRCQLARRFLNHTRNTLDCKTAFKCLSCFQAHRMQGGGRKERLPTPEDGAGHLCLLAKSPGREN